MKPLMCLSIASLAVPLGLPAAAQDNSAAPTAEAQTSAVEAAPSSAVTTPADTAEAGPVTAATVTDFREGITVRDPQGGLVGTVESLDSEGAVVSTGNVRAKLPFQSFGKNNLGLVISLTRAELEAAAAAQSPS